MTRLLTARGTGLTPSKSPLTSFMSTLFKFTPPRRSRTRLKINFLTFVFFIPVPVNPRRVTTTHPPAVTVAPSPRKSGHRNIPRPPQEFSVVVNFCRPEWDQPSNQLSSGAAVPESQPPFLTVIFLSSAASAQARWVTVNWKWSPRRSATSAARLRWFKCQSRTMKSGRPPPINPKRHPFLAFKGSLANTPPRGQPRRGNSKRWGLTPRLLRGLIPQTGLASPSSPWAPRSG